MDKDELNKYKWLDAQEVRPKSRTPSDHNVLKQQSRLTKKMLEFLME